MIETAWTFWRKNVRKHTTRIVATTHPYLSGLLAMLVVGYSGLTVKPFVLAGFFVPYDTVVFGFTATAVALSIALPSERFIKFLSQIRDGTTPFRDFLFILAWNGVVHILAFFMFIPVVFIGDQTSFGPTDAVGKLQVFVFFALWVQFYACFQFLVTTIGVYELADLYGTYCASLRKADDANQGQ
ncbi:hypothetical protein ACRQ5Q_11885 [Bradyrhizobium sp. PMVTL-01]|uniref:hypothetical protein n=1 Tax=Bradyrhizobium sp. PMVTL-01 TaxID=3434999 RepID=UPI003F70376C